MTMSAKQLSYRFQQGKEIFFFSREKLLVGRNYFKNTVKSTELMTTNIHSKNENIREMSWAFLII
jgi:hypothetical protein